LKQEDGLEQVGNKNGLHLLVLDYIILIQRILNHQLSQHN